MADTRMQVPVELSSRNQWVIWRLIRRKGAEKPTKVPFTHTGRQASSTNPGDWCSFKQAQDAVRRGRGQGVGFVFSPGDPFCGIDLDQCFMDDGSLHPEAKKVVEQMGSYTEVSPSGTGLHIIARAEVGAGGRRTSETPWGANLEVYDQGRYFTFTGQPYEGYEQIDDAQLQLEHFFEGKGESSSGSTLVDTSWKDELADKELFDDLNSGDWESHYESHSEADLAFVNMLVNAMGPWDQFAIFEAFKSSGLYRGEEKAGGDGYVVRTIRKSIKDAFEAESTDDTKVDKQVSKELQRLRVRDEARRLRTEEVAGPVSLPEMGDLATELQLPLIEEVYRIDQLHPARGNVLLVARQKSGKTTLTLNLLRALADDQPFLGKYEVTPFDGRILVVNYEETQQQWLRHVHKLGLRNPERIRTLHRRGQGIMPLWDRAYRKHLVQQMRDQGIQYWIMDPAAVAWQGLVDNENDNALMTRFTVALDEVKYESGCQELMLTHHSGRADDERGRGASRLEDWMDAGWYLSRNDGGQREMWALGRDVQVERHALDWDESRWALVAGKSESEKEHYDEVQSDKDFRRTILEILTEAKGEGYTKSRLYEEALNRGCHITKPRALKKLSQYGTSRVVKEIVMVADGRAQRFYLDGFQPQETDGNQGA